MKKHIKKVILNSSNDIRYLDYQGILGQVGDTYTYNELVDMYNDLKDYDPVVDAYNNIQDWLTDTINNMKKVNSCRITADTDGYLYFTKHGVGPGTLPKNVKLVNWKDVDDNITAIWLDRFLTTKELNEYDIYPETSTQHKTYLKQVEGSADPEASYRDLTEWVELDTKTVKDFDGFTTDYTLYTNGREFICMFGDKDLYEPNPDYADYATENKDEAYDWFYSYEGCADDEDVYSSEYTPNRIPEEKLQKLGASTEKKLNSCTITASRPDNQYQHYFAYDYKGTNRFHVHYDDVTDVEDPESSFKQLRASVSLIKPYDDGEYAWARIQNGTISYIRTGKVIKTEYYFMFSDYGTDEDPLYENANEWIDDVLNRACDTLIELNKNVKRRMIHNSTSIDDMVEDDDDFDRRWNEKFGEPSTEVFTPEEFDQWMKEVNEFE